MTLSLLPPATAAAGAGASPTTHRVSVVDQVQETGSTHADVVRATLHNGRSRLAVSLRFRSLRLGALGQVVIGVDVDGSQRDHLIRLRQAAGSLRGSLSSAILFSDGSTAQRVSCPRLRVTVRRDTVHVAVPRSCLRIGGDRARFHWFVRDRHGHHDESPWNRSGFSPWTKRAR